MYTSFESLSDNARMWVYQSSRSLTVQEQEKIVNASKSFIDQWTAHGNNLKASFNILYDRFLILAVDEEIHNATGCSIDASVAFVKSVEQEFNLELFDRTQIAYVLNAKIEIESLNNFKNKVKTGEIPESAKVFNNAVSVKSDLDQNWLLPLVDSWAGRFLPSTAM